MRDYQAPLKEMLFIVQHAVQTSGIDHLDALTEFDMETVAAVLEAAGDFAERALAPLNTVGDTQGCVFSAGKVSTPSGWKNAFDQFCQDGWMGLALPCEYGGQALPKFIAQPVNEMWHSANLSFVMFHALGQGASEILLRFGSESQKSRYLEKIIAGQYTVAMALTEPAAGSDLGALKTKATPNKDGSYRISGQKIYITYGEHDLAENIIHLVLARTPDAPAGSRGISLFAVPKVRINTDGSLGEPNDIICTGIEHKTGLHGSPTCSISYGDTDSCIGELIGDENRGLEAMFILMNEARLSVGVQGIALGELAYQRAQAYALERPQGTHYATKAASVPIVQHPDVIRMLLGIKSQLIGQRSLAYLIASLVDLADYSDDLSVKHKTQSRIALLTPVFKAFATEQANLWAGSAIQIFGGMGFVEETGIAQVMRDARITTIYEGTTGIQAKDLLFRKIRADKAKALSELLDEIEAAAVKLRTRDSLDRLGVDLSSAVAHFRSLIPIMIDDSSDPLMLNAGAVPLLEALGTLLSQWQLSEIALRAMPAIDAKDDIGFHANFVALAHFHNAHHLPLVAARLSSFVQASEGIAEFNFSE